MASRLHNRRPCATCRARRVRCDAEERRPEKCSRCERLGFPCLPEDEETQIFARESNDRSELMNELTRFDSLVRTLEDSSDATESTASDYDLVGSLTRLCFTPQMRISATQDPFLQDVKATLTEEEIVHERLFGIARPIDTEVVDATMEQLLDMLPPLEESRTLVDHQMRGAASTSAAGHHLYHPPGFADLIRNFAAAAREPDDFTDANVLAELHAFVAITTMDREGSRALAEAFNVPNVMNALSLKARRHVEAAKRALEIADYSARPSMAASRCLLMLAEVYVAFWPSTERLSEGVSFARIGAALVQTLDLLDEDAELRAGETTLERYDRRAIVTGLARILWWEAAFSAHTDLVNERLLHVPPPDYLEDADLPAEYRGTGRSPPEEFDLFHLHHDLIRHQHVTARLLAPGAKATAHDRAAQARQIEELAERLPHRLGFQLDEYGELIPNAPLSSDRERLMRATLNVTVLVCKVNVYRISLCMPAPSSSISSTRLARERAELVDNARRMLSFWSDMIEAAGATMAGFGTAFSSYVVIALTVMLDIETPDSGRLREEIMSATIRLDKPELRYRLPASIRRLVTVMKMLLNRPRRRQAERRPASRAEKRIRAGFSERLGRSTVASDDEERLHKAPTSSEEASPASTASPPSAAATHYSLEPASDPTPISTSEPSPVLDRLGRPPSAGAFTFQVPSVTRSTSREGDGPRASREAQSRHAVAAPYPDVPHPPP